MVGAGSPGGAADSVDAANHIALGVGGICLTDVGQGLGVAQDGDGFFKLCKVGGADDHRSIVAVTGDDDAFVLAFDTVDDLRQVVTNPSQRLSSSHAHNCGAQALPC